MSWAQDSHCSWFQGLGLDDLGVGGFDFKKALLGFYGLGPAKVTCPFFCLKTLTKFFFTAKTQSSPRKAKTKPIFRQPIEIRF
jgi:hypothetical protein